KIVSAISILVAAAAALWAGLNHFVFSGDAHVGASSKAVVEEFFAAINKHDWLRMWSLGDKYLGYGPYNTLLGMTYGYRCTERDVPRGLNSNGNVVSGFFVAHDSNRGVRTEQTYSFRFVVSHGAIRRGNQKLLSGRAPPGCD